jgi:trehalose 6-phosphate synthase
VSGQAALVVAANRAPLTFAVEPGGELVAKHAAGGLAPSLLRALEGREAVWVAAAGSQADRRALQEGAPAGLSGGARLRLVDVPQDVYQAAYRVIANATLWFCYHGMVDRVHRPVIDRRWHDAWEGFREYARRVAAEISSSALDGATVVVNDYHMALVGGILAAERPDLATVHFAHTPFSEPEELRVLPRAVRHELLSSMAGFGACGFHTTRWATAFGRCCDAELGRAGGAFVAPLGSEPSELLAVAESARCRRLAGELLDRLDGRRLVVRSDRVEPSKNLLRGFLGFAELLERSPRWRGRVVFVARTYPSRQDLPEYLAYRSETEALVERINERHATADWQPIVLEVADDFEATVAAYCCYDVLLVNPLRDGMNLVAKEGPLVNRRDGVLVLSAEAGAYDELAEGCVEVEPYDVSGTASALEAALSMEPGERARKARLLAERAAAHPPAAWLGEVMAQARRPAALL